ncbi:MAG TPA: hypothetical protein VF144_00585 [Chitinophagaceae bacterium]
MNKKFLYGTISSAINTLRKIGFNKDFSLEDDHIFWNNIKLDINDLRIVSVCRYEGNSDPADEASVYALESQTGLKGILITNDDANSDASSGNLLKYLHSKFLNSIKTKEQY